jgi:hypothetical protein
VAEELLLWLRIEDLVSMFLLKEPIQRVVMHAINSREFSVVCNHSLIGISSFHAIPMVRLYLQISNSDTSDQ